VWEDFHGALLRTSYSLDPTILLISNMLTIGQYQELTIFQTHPKNSFVNLMEYRKIKIIWPPNF
jgi:hypothetical protein